MEGQEPKERLVQKIQGMNVAEKVKLALKGGSEARSILIKDSNRQVVLSVLENQQLSDPEVERVARNRSALEEVLRIISKKKAWMKNYPIAMALVSNPRTPPGIAMRFVSGFKKKDLKLLSKDRGVSEAVRITAKRALQMKEKS